MDSSSTISGSNPTALTRNARQLRLDTLVRLRWLAIAGQALAVALVRFGLGFPLPFGLCFVAIVASAFVNLVLRVEFPASHRLGDSTRSGRATSAGRWLPGASRGWPG